MLPSILVIIFIVIFIVQMGYWLLLYRSFATSKSPISNQTEVPVSVIIAARDEAVNLDKNLPQILQQKHSNFEVIVVNDASVDRSSEIIKKLQEQYSQLKAIDIPKSVDYSGSKKNALTQGIQLATHENLLFTDADCSPVSPFWIRSMTTALEKDSSLVLGYGAYKKLPGFLNKLIRYETLLTALQYFSYAIKGLPYMGVGRNLSYKKELFNQANGFESHRSILSGDDDLFINQVASKENCSCCFSKESFTESTPKTSFASWFQQKRRHISTATSYKSVHKLLLGLFYLSQLLFWVLAISVLSFSLNWQLVILLVSIRQIVQFMILSKTAAKLNERDLIVWTPILEFVLIATQFVLFMYHTIQRPKHW